MEGRQLSSQKDITVAVAAHKPYCMPNDKCYLPLHVGADLHPEVCLDMQQDNLGDNISKKTLLILSLLGCTGFGRIVVPFIRAWYTTGGILKPLIRQR